MRVFKHPLWSRFTTIVWPFFQSEMRTKAIGGFILLAVLLLGVNGMNFINSYVMRDFMTALEQKQIPRFYLLGLALAGLFGIAVIGEAFQLFIEQRMGLVWREWLTHRLLDRYLAHRGYHRLTINQSVDNPDQRISEDIKTFTASSLSFLVLLFDALLALSLFLGVLWSITPWLVLTAVLYSAVGSLSTILLGRRLVSLNNRQFQKEADFRFDLGRVRERGEAGGGVKERLRERFDAVVANFRAIIRVSRNVGFFTKEYNYLLQIIPPLVVASLYFRERVQFGVIAQSAIAFGHVVGAFSLIVTKFQEISTFAAVVNRLGSMWEATGSAPEPPKGMRAEPPHPEHTLIETAADDHRIAYEKLTLWTPQNKYLFLRDLSLEVPEGKRMLVSGPDGCGKTALCLATAGLWSEGEGKVVCPGMKHIMFLPQRLYTATGRLRELLLYGLDGKDVSDEQLHDTLEDVGLGRLSRAAEGLEGVWDWRDDLTPGDRHALALARLLLAKPRFAFLDGVPWGLAPERLKRLYEGLARTSITYISVGTAAGLQPFHDLWLELYGDGRWRLRETGTATTQARREDGVPHPAGRAAAGPT